MPNILIDNNNNTTSCSVDDREDDDRFHVLSHSTYVEPDNIPTKNGVVSLYDKRKNIFTKDQYVREKQNPLLNMQDL